MQHTQYIKISTSSSLDRRALALLGFGTKRGSEDDASVIGNKGSGMKLAPIAALRLGLEMAIASTDVFGTYLLRFELEDVDVGGIPTREIIRVYENQTNGNFTVLREPSRIVLEAFQDGDKSIGSDDKTQFRVVREPTSNAVDIDKQPKFEVVERITHVPVGTTAVYLPYTWEIYHMLFDPEQVARYFKFLSAAQPLFGVSKIGSIYPKSDPQNSRLFGLGVLVDCVTNATRTSVFDYSMERKALVSEERTIKNIYEYMNEVAKLFGQLTNRPIMKNLLSAVENGEATFEAQVLGRTGSFTPESKQLWLSVVHEVLGEKIAIASGDKVIDVEYCERVFGHKIVGAVNADLAKFLRYVGVPSAKEIVPKHFSHDLVSYFAFDAASRMRFREAFRLFVKYFPEGANMEITFYYPTDSLRGKIAGFAAPSASGEFTRCWMAAPTRSTLPPVDDMFTTLFHEWHHIYTKARDVTSALENQMDRTITTIVLRIEGFVAHSDGTPILFSDESNVPIPNIIMPYEVDPSRAPPPGDDDTDEILVEIEELTKM